MRAPATDATVGRRVHLRNVTVEDTARDRGVFIDAPNRTVFVLPAGEDQARVQPGRAVTIRGVVLQMPRGMDRRLNAQGDLNDDVYVLATSIDDRSRPSN